MNLATATGASEDKNEKKKTKKKARHGLERREREDGAPAKAVVRSRGGCLVRPRPCRAKANCVLAR